MSGGIVLDASGYRGEDDETGDVTNVVREEPARSRFEGEEGRLSARIGDLGPRGFLVLPGDGVEVDASAGSLSLAVADEFNVELRRGGEVLEVAASSYVGSMSCVMLPTAMEGAESCQVISRDSAAAVPCYSVAWVDRTGRSFSRSAAGSTRAGHWPLLLVCIVRIKAYNNECSIRA